MANNSKPKPNPLVLTDLQADYLRNGRSAMVNGRLITPADVEEKDGKLIAKAVPEPAKSIHITPAKSKTATDTSGDSSGKSGDDKDDFPDDPNASGPAK